MGFEPTQLMLPGLKSGSLDHSDIRAVPDCLIRTGDQSIYSRLLYQLSYGDKNIGAAGHRSQYLFDANEALYHLSYSPICLHPVGFEPTQLTLPGLKSGSLDHSDMDAFFFSLPVYFYCWIV